LRYRDDDASTIARGHRRVTGHRAICARFRGSRRVCFDAPGSSGIDIMAKDIAAAVREICLSFPDAAERLSHGSPDFHVRGKTFASFVVNHHGDGRIAFWLAAPPGAQQHYVEAEPEYFFVPPYVGPRGWLGVHLNKGLDWTRVARHVREAYLVVAPKKLTVDLPPAIVIEAPTESIDPDVLDPLSSKRAQKVVAPLREFCLSLPEASEDKAFGWPVWRAGKKTFAGVHRYNRRLTLQFWVGLDMQAMLTFERRYRVPAYIGHNGWIELDVEDDFDFDEVRQLVLVSYKHFALKRMLDRLAAEADPPPRRAASQPSKRPAPKSTARSKTRKKKRTAPRANR
jgi:predicted DNA-binding protein (MmcQ/YjbR family)